MNRLSRMFLQRRLFGKRRAASVATLLSALIPGLMLTAAPSSAVDGAPPPRSAGPAVAAGTATVTITLITGDQVTVRAATRGGRVQVLGTRPVPRAGGTPVAFTTLTDGSRTYVVPSDALRDFASGALDRELFDVGYLAANGYGDATTATLPVILQYQRHANAAAQSLPAASTTTALPAINAAAAQVAKQRASAFWQAIRGQQPGTGQPGTGQPGTGQLGRGLAKVWLDARVTADDAASDAQMGVPAAWAAGYNGTGVAVGVIDTGIDQSHPDLTGKVAAAQNFVPAGDPGGGNPDDVTDRYGHGTHVASIIAGTGAQSAGKYEGVAPGANLIIAKALDDTGSGDLSTIIAAMQWEAGTEHARVVNMSLGAGPSDGSDPLSQAIDALTAQYGTLFVVAAGNAGPDQGTVTAPGAADAALAVAAVDGNDKLASFSSQGPRAGDYGLKPDIAAPGVSVVAARAAGTSLGSDDGIPGDGPVDQYYTAASGTSMATPQVAGAAAILAGQHPGWQADQLKDALMSTAHDDGYDVYQQGAGRVDVARAVGQQVDAATPDLSYGEFFAGQTTPVTKTVTYQNDSAKDVTLNLTAALGTVDGQAAPAGTLALSASSVTVPASGTARVSVTLDPARAPAGSYTGAVRATDGADGIQLTTPAGYTELDQVHFHVTPPAAPDAYDYVWVLTRVDKPAPVIFFASDGFDSTQALLPGTYSVTTFVLWTDPADGVQTAMLVNPEFAVRGSTEVDLSASDARKIAIDVGRTPAERYSAEFGYNRAPAGYPAVCCTGVTSVSWSTGYSQLSYWVTPTAPVRTGTFKYTSNWMLGTPLLSARVEGGHPMTLHPQYGYDDPSIPKLAGQGTAPVVFVHDGQPADFQGVDLHGKIALLHVPSGYSLDAGTYCGGTSALPSVTAAAAAGAIAVLGYTDTGRPCTFPGPDASSSSLSGGHSMFAVPTATLRADEGAALAGLASDGPVRVRYDGAPVAADLYFLSLGNEGTVPASVTYSLRDSDLATISTRFHASGPSIGFVSAYGYQPDDFTSSLQWYDFTAPATIAEHFGPLSPSITWQRVAGGYNSPQQWPIALQANYEGESQSTSTFTRATSSADDWGTTPVVPGAQVIPASVLAQGAPGPWLSSPSWTVCADCRQGNDFIPAFFETGESPLISGQLTAYEPYYGGASDLHLYSGGQEIQPVANFLVPVYQLPPGSARYTLTSHFVLPFPASGPLMQGAADTSWTFTSARPDVNTVSQTSYICFGNLAPASTGLDTGPCQADPLIFLSYDLRLGLDNTLAAGPHTFLVTAYRQPSDQRQPAVTGLSLSVSYDNGTTWQQARVQPQGDGTFLVTTLIPRGATGAVSLKTQAWDSAGNTVQQTISGAAALSGASR